MNKKLAKILALVLTTAALLALAIGFSVSAEEEAPTLDILSKNMSYGSNFQLAFAVDNTGIAEGQEIEVLLYAEDPSVNPEATAHKAVLAKNTKYDGVYPVFFSYGIPAKDLTSYVWAQAHIVGTETYGKVYRYSAVEYFYERLYTETSDVTEAQAKLYNTVLTYCADAQAVLSYTSPAIGDVNYVFVNGGTLDDINYSALLTDDASFTPVYSGVVEAGKRVVWDVTSIAADGAESTETAFEGNAFTVSGDVTVCRAKLIEGPVYAGVAGTGEYYKNATGTKFTCNAVAKGTSYTDFDSRSGAATATVFNNEYVQLHKGASEGRPYFQYNNNAAKPADAENIVMIAEADFAFGGTSVADGNDPLNPYLIAFYFDTFYCALYFDVNTDGKITLVSSHTVCDNGFELDADTWYNLRFEIHDLTENGLANETAFSQSSAVIKVYVNGECLADVRPMDVATRTNSNRMNVNVQDVTSGYNDGAYVCLDNVFLGYDDKAFTQLVPDGAAVVSGTHNGGAYYNGSYDGERSNCSTKPGISASVNAASMVTLDKFTYVYRTGESGHAYTSPVSLTYPTDGTTPSTIIELDYAVGDNDLASYSTIIKYRYGDKQVGFYFGIVDGKVTLHNSLVAGQKIALDIDTWYNLRFEIYGLDAIKVFVNGVWACDVKGLDTGSASTSHSLSLTLQGKAGVADYGYHAYDNVYIGFTDATYVAGQPTESSILQQELCPAVSSRRSRGVLKQTFITQEEKHENL